MTKKYLFGLLTAGILATGMNMVANAQSGRVIHIPNKNVAVKMPKKNIGEYPTPYAQANPVVSAPANSYSRSLNRTIIGTTTYDLQTNNSVCNRLIKNADGTLCATWTFSSGVDHPGFADRGTGYNYFNGTSWGTQPTSRVEGKRTGWPSIAVTGSGGEAFVCHNTTISQLQITTRPAKGTGTWTEDEVSLVSPSTGGNWWPRMAAGGANGNSLHMISITYPVASGGVLYEGLDGAFTYSRSLDGGLTWGSPAYNLIPGYDTSRIFGMTADAYAIDARGDVVAILVGDGINDLILLKSTDNGSTWSTDTVFDFPIDKWDYETTISDINADGVPDTLDSYDGTVAVLIDNNDEVHAFFGKMRYFQDAPTAGGGYSYFPGTDLLMHWKESNPAGIFDTVAGVLDRNGDFTLNVPNSGTATPFGTYGNSLTSFPSAGISADGKIYVTYSSIFEGTDNGSAKAYRHQYVTVSRDNGLTWSIGSDLIPADEDPEFTEGCYGAIARSVDGFVHIIHQEDAQPGQSLAGDPAGSTDPENVGQTNNIIYTKLDTTLDVSGLNKIKALGGMQLFPNPGNGVISIAVTEDGSVIQRVELFDINGRMIVGGAVQTNGNPRFTAIDASLLPKGVYSVRVSTNKGIHNEKFIRN